MGILRGLQILNFPSRIFSLKEAKADVRKAMLDTQDSTGRSDFQSS